MMTFHRWISRAPSWFCCLILASLGVGCGAMHGIKPLARGDSQWSLAVGGPLLKGGTPVPVAAVGYAYGMHELVTLHGDVNLTAAIFKTASLGGGALLGINQQQGWLPASSLDLQLNLASDLNSTVVLPETTWIGSYPNFSAQHVPYFGVAALYQFYDNPTAFLPVLYLTPFLGWQWQIHAAWQLAGEVRFAGFHHANRQETLEFVHLPGTDYGIVAPAIMLRYALGGE